MKLCGHYRRLVKGDLDNSEVCQLDDDETITVPPE